jgi:hypothetical protein
VEDFCWDYNVSIIADTCEVALNHLFDIAQIRQAFDIFGDEDFRLRNFHNFPHPHIELPTALNAWCVDVTQLSVVGFMRTESESLSSNAEVLAGEPSRNYIYLGWEHPNFTLTVSLDEVNNAFQFVDVSSLASLAEVLDPSRLGVWANVIGENSLKSGSLEPNPALFDGSLRPGGLRDGVECRRWHNEAAFKA